MGAGQTLAKKLLHKGKLLNEDNFAQKVFFALGNNFALRVIFAREKKNKLIKKNVYIYIYIN